MKKKILALSLAGIIFISPVLAKTDKTSEDYLKSKKHFAILNTPSEGIAEKIIKKSLKKDTNADFKVKLNAYTASSLKQGIFKYLEITGKDVTIDGIEVPYINLKTLTDYNKIDFSSTPLEIKTDTTFEYNIELSETSINQALEKEDYQKTLKNVNKRAYPLFVIKKVQVRIRSNKIYIIMYYNFPIAPDAKDRTFMASTGLQVSGGKVSATGVEIDSAYGSLSLDKVTNLVNLLEPLSYTLSIMDSKKYEAAAENIDIVDNIIKVNGKIFVKGE